MSTNKNVKGPDAAVNTKFPDMWQKLMNNSWQNSKIKDLKSPEELVITLNNIRLNTLINTGCVRNAQAEENNYEYYNEPSSRSI